MIACKFVRVDVGVGRCRLVGEKGGGGGWGSTGRTRETGVCVRVSQIERRAGVVGPGSFHEREFVQVCVWCVCVYV